jgi:lipopolysaccharide/colanic/teichoic acid biosynthesis glycosyltransferase
MIKRIIDGVVAALGLAVLSPVLLALAIAVRLSSPGPALYRGIRVGQAGKPFRMLKFRTMVANAEKLGGSCTGNDDPRITALGRWLRKYKLDELPQLINVLRGEMSIVGPRPEVQKYVDLFKEEERVILSVRPGITDWATLWDSDEGAILAGSPDPERTYLEQVRPGKLRLQLKYVHEQCFWVDMKIFFATIGVLMSRCFGNSRVQQGGVQDPTGKLS